ncbi:hypothetical protein AB2L57_10670 [Microbacterium sp. HA-8]|uniref:hypothetical protein n=1 Tax=Microbacterium sp. HA-8 TaxID=3234200 RepID=UPI0038F63E9B
MTDIILFDDPEALVVAYLRDVLPGYGITLPVGTAVPRTPEGKPASQYVRVLLTGGSTTSPVTDESLIVIEVHYGIDDDSTVASRAASLIRGLMAAMPRHTPAVRQVREVGRPVPRTHPVTGAPSYSQSHAITTRGL